jgi:hypothetical protein
MSQPIVRPSHQRFSLFVLQIACVVFGLGVSACGSSGSGNVGGASGQGSGGVTGGGGASGGGVTGSGGAAGTAGASGGRGGAGAGGGGVTGSGGAAGTGGASGGRGGAGGGMPLPGTPCSTNQDCGPGFTLTCRAPGEFLGCGTCRQGSGNCGSDTDCAADAGTTGGKLICEPAPSSSCFCPNPSICQAGCRAKSDCPSNQGCNRLHHCQNTCVPGDGTCPVDFSCGADGFCAQTSCTTDAECSGACVKGLCYSSRGSCAYTPL